MAAEAQAQLQLYQEQLALLERDGKQRLAEGEAAPEPLAIRGYKLLKRGQHELSFFKGTHVVDDPADMCGALAGSCIVS